MRDLRLVEDLREDLKRVRLKAKNAAREYALLDCTEETLGITENMLESNPKELKQPSLWDDIDTCLEASIDDLDAVKAECSNPGKTKLPKYLDPGIRKTIIVDSEDEPQDFYITGIFKKPRAIDFMLTINTGQDHSVTRCVDPRTGADRQEWSLGKNINKVLYWFEKNCVGLQVNLL